MTAPTSPPSTGPGADPGPVFAPGGATGTLQRTAVSHIALSVPDLAATEAFYAQVLGMVRHETLGGGPHGPGVRLGWGSGHHVLDLHEGSRALLHHGFEVRDPGGLDALAQRLRSAGHHVEDLDPGFVDAAAGRAQGLVTTDPDGTRLHFHAPVHRQGESTADPGRRPVKFQHTTVGTDDVGPMVDFFTSVVGFSLSDQLADGSFAWMRSDRDHHSLAVVRTGSAGTLDHYSYDLSVWEDFKTWCDRLTELGVAVAWGPGRHGPGDNLFVFFDDPAGNHVELSAEMEKFHDDRVVYAPRRWTAMPASVNLWGGQLPSWRRAGPERSGGTDGGTA